VPLRMRQHHCNNRLHGTARTSNHMLSINSLVLAIVRGTRQVLHHSSRLSRMLSSQHSSRDSSKLGAVSRLLSLPSRAVEAL